MAAPPLIFIRYAGPDRAIAKRIHRALNAAGLHPWCDALDLLPGQKWDKVIPGVLVKAAVVLVIVTARWPAVGVEGVGWYGPEEVAIAIDHARRADPRMAIVPVRLDGVGSERLPYGLRRLVEIEAGAADPRPIVEGVSRVLDERAGAALTGSAGPQPAARRRPTAHHDARSAGRLEGRNRSGGHRQARHQAQPARRRPSRARRRA